MNIQNRSDPSSINRPQVKVCGLTNVEQAIGCVKLGVNAIGCVFYPKSPRNVTEEQAKDICSALPPEVKSVGVFVDKDYSFIMRKAEKCGLDAVQLHGMEPPGLAGRLAKENLIVIKGLFVKRNPGLEAVSIYESASAFLVECGKGRLPGGNAETWDWSVTKDFAANYPLVLAGGLNPENIAQAVITGEPDAVDISSGVESSPGWKDLSKVKAFMNGIPNAVYSRAVRRIF